MRLARLVCVWVVASVSCLAMGRTRHNKEERHLSYDVSPKVPFPSSQSIRHHYFKNPTAFSDQTSLGGSVSSLTPSGGSTPATPSSFRSSHHGSGGPGRHNTSYTNLYYSLISDMKREGKGKNLKKTRQSVSVIGDRELRKHSHSDRSAPTEAARVLFNQQANIKNLAGTQNVIYSKSRVKLNIQHQPVKSNHLTTAYPAIFITPKPNKHSKTTTLPPWRHLSEIPSLKNTDDTFPATSQVVKYPYSKTFQSFDSFLNSIGTSFRLDGDSHAIRTRSDNGSNSLQESGESLGYSQAGTIQIDGEDASQSSQDLFENNALGIDVLEQDKVRAATFLNMPERCCGSKVPFDPENAKAIGGFSRVAAAGSVKVVEVPDKDTDILSPSVIRDLKITVTGPRSIRMDWTATGDDLDHGKVSGYVIRLSDTRYDLREGRFDQAVTFTEVDLHDLLEVSGVFQEAGNAVKVTFNVDERVPTRLRSGQQYYVALRAIDDFNNTSPVSNVATFTLPILGQSYILDTTTTTTPPPTTTTTTLPPTSTTTTAVPFTTTEFISSEEYTTTESEELQNQIIPVVTQEGRVIPKPLEEDRRKRKKGRKEKGKKRNNRERKGKKDRKSKKGPRTSTEVEEPVTTPASTFDPSNRNDNPGCYGDSGQRVSDGRLCDAISALLTVIDYFEHTREYKHLDYLSNIIVTLRYRAQPHWRGT